MQDTILSTPFVRELILPFLLVFALVFAILDKTKILGEEKRQINAIVAFVIGLIFISFGKAVGITVNLLGVVAVLAIILLVFFMLYFFAAGEKEATVPKGLKITFGILIAAVIVVSLLVFTGFWDYIIKAVIEGNRLAVNIIFVIIIIAAIAIVLTNWKKA